MLQVDKQRVAIRTALFRALRLRGGAHSGHTHHLPPLVFHTLGSGSGMRNTIYLWVP